MNPEPEDELGPPEIRGGDRPDDYMPDEGIYGLYLSDEQLGIGGDEDEDQ